MALETFTDSATAVVIGASGGIGSAIADQLEANDAFATVHRLSRSAEDKSHRIDITDEASIERAADSIEGPIDLVFVATGILHGDGIEPEKTMRQLDAGVMQQVFLVNSTGPTIVAKHFLPKLRKDAKTVFATLSARVGSISDNGLGGWLSYRASKAALNMALKTLSIEHNRKRSKSVVIALHPGTVDTGLSEPFQNNVPDEKLFDRAYAADKLLSVIDGVTADDTGEFFAYDGSRIEY